MGVDPKRKTRSKVTWKERKKNGLDIKRGSQFTF